MPAIVDNLIAYRVLSMLVKPFAETDAYRLGIVDDKGANLIKSRDFTTTDQKNAYTYLHRLVFNLKKLLMKLPGGDSKLKNLIAAFFLVKEAYASRSINVDRAELERLVEMLDRGVILAEEQLVIEEFFLVEDGMGGGIANVTGAGVSTDIPVIRKAKRFGKFTVRDEVFNKFADGKAKFRRWASYLNMEDEGEKMIYNFARNNPRSAIILHNGADAREIRFNASGR